MGTSGCGTSSIDRFTLRFQDSFGIRIKKNSCDLFASVISLVYGTRPFINCRSCFTPTRTADSSPMECLTSISNDKTQWWDIVKSLSVQKRSGWLHIFDSPANNLPVIDRLVAISDRLSSHTRQNSNHLVKEQSFSRAVTPRTIQH